MFYAGVAFLVFLSLGGLLYLLRFFRSIGGGRPARAMQDQFNKLDIVLALLLVAFWIFNAWQGFHMQHMAITAVGVAAEAFIIYLPIILLIFGVLMGESRNPLMIFGLRWSNWKQALPPCWLALLVMYPILLLVTVIVQHLLGPNVAAQDIVEFLRDSSSWKDRVVVGLMAVVCAPIAEEVMFRGYLYGVARQYLGRGFAMVATALLFAVIHAHIPSLAGLFIFAIFLTLVYEKTGSLWASMAMHATFNAVTVAVTLLWPDLPS